MKRRILAGICLTFFYFLSNAQSFYNGSFETHTFTACTPTVADIVFNSKMAHVKAFGRTFVSGYGNVGKISIQDSGCSVIPQDGEWCIGLHSAFNTTSDAIALELTSPLVTGMDYQLSFFLHGNTGFQNQQSPVDIGESINDFTIGNHIYRATPGYLSWQNVTFTFTASQASKHITAKIIPGYNSWAQLDNFVISSYPVPVGINEDEANGFFQVYPNPVRNELRVQFANDPEAHLLELYNQLGQTACQKRIVQSQTALIDVSALPAGIYYLSVSNSRTTVKKRILISHE
jgi:hypothetical protein